MNGGNKIMARSKLVKANEKIAEKVVPEDEIFLSVHKDNPASLRVQMKNGAYIHGEMLMYGKEASNRKQEIDRQHHTIPNKRTKDKHYGNVHNRLWNHG